MGNFKQFNLAEPEEDKTEGLSPQKVKLRPTSTIMERSVNHDELLDSKELQGLIKKL